MASDIDGIGTVLTGGIVAHAAEHEAHPGDGGGHAHAGPGGACLNCGAIRAGEFCQDCGQSGHVHRHVIAIGHDIAHGVFHFEGRFWSTLPLLIRHPGDLTRRYVHGERVRFVSPMALFLFSVFLLFAAVNRISMADVADSGQVLAKAQVDLATQRARSARTIATLGRARADLIARDPTAPTADIDARIADATRKAAALRMASAQLPRGRPARIGDTADSTDLESGIKEMNVDTGYPSLDRQIEHVKDNPELYAYKLKMASYKYSWALIPISVPFIWLMFCWWRDVGLYDHAIFAIYSLSFMTLLTVGLIGLYLVGVPESLLWLTILIAPPVHMYRQLKRGYLLSRAGALWRTAFLLVATTIAGSLFFALLIWLEAE